jgi:EAL domain-containing protein (putative c-di-GMP-specific phosphodiesterase class I)
VQTVGVEALMRWSRNGVLVPPGDFIPLAEETGLIVPLSEWALREAARQSRAWRDAFGFSESIAVNLPNRLFERIDLVGFIREVTTQYGVSNGAIELEITETGLMKHIDDAGLKKNSLMKDSGSVNRMLYELDDMGVEISIDDFGTGYSSLSYLIRLPISELKIDRSFVRELGLVPKSSDVVTAIIALARSLGLRVVAEGVETLRQMEVLHRLGCRLMQGFLFSPPLPPERMQDWREQRILGREAAWIVGRAEEGPDDAPGGKHLRAAGGQRRS